MAIGLPEPANLPLTSKGANAGLIGENVVDKKIPPGRKARGGM